MLGEGGEYQFVITKLRVLPFSYVALLKFDRKYSRLNTCLNIYVYL